MAEYIDKFAVAKMLDRLEDEIKQYEPFTPRERAICCRVHETGIMIALMRSEDVAPVRHGRWLTWEEQFPGEKPRRSNNLGVFCDKCNNHADNRTDFCPNCGANMKGES